MDESHETVLAAGGVVEDEDDENVIEVRENSIGPKVEEY